MQPRRSAEEASRRASPRGCSSAWRSGSGSSGSAQSAADLLPSQTSITFGSGSSARTIGATRIPLAFWGTAEGQAVTRERQDRAFSLALGGNLKQLGIERPHAEGSGFLRPDQIADLIALRGGADAGAVLGGASAPSSGSTSLAGLFSTPFGEWSTAAKLGAGVALLGALALLRGVLR